MGYLERRRARRVAITREQAIARVKKPVEYLCIRASHGKQEVHGWIPRESAEECGVRIPEDWPSPVWIDSETSHALRAHPLWVDDNVFQRSAPHPQPE